MTGRRRHLAVATLGLPLAVAVTRADAPDGDGAYALLPAVAAVAPTLTHVRVDGAYEGDWAAWAAEGHHVTGEVVCTPAGQHGFAVQAKRWVVERTFAWRGRNRRLSRAFERYEQTAEALIYLASCHLLLKRLRPASNS